MKIENIDKLVEQDIFKHRICKIKYSSAYENYLKEKLSLLGKRYNVFQIENLFLEDNVPEQKNSLKNFRIGLLKNILGLTPKYGAILTILFSIADTISFLKISDLEKLREKLQLKEKPHKKYKNIKNIFIIKNVSYLSADEIVKVQFVQELIEKKFIVNTLLIFCEPIDYPSCIDVSQEAVHTLPLDNTVLQNIYKFSLCEDKLELVAILGIEYAEYVRDIETTPFVNTDFLVKKLIHDMLQKAGYTEEESLTDFLKLCSLLFDVFSYEDVEKISDLKNVCYEKEIKKTIDSKLFKSDVLNQYQFFVDNIRKYYQSSARFYAGEIKKHILRYLIEKYPHRYTDLALAHIWASDSNEEKISFCLKALYYDQRKAPACKMEEIMSYLSSAGCECVNIILKLNEIYSSFHYSQSNAESLCGQCFYELLDLDFLSPEDKLICLSSISKVSYEIMKQPFLLEIDAEYRELFARIAISRTYAKYTSFILDYVVFSTCIEQCFITSQVVQRLIKYLQKSNISLQNKIRYSRLGNALFFNDPDKGMVLTKQAYELSEGYVIEHMCSAVNYSCSLGICGMYETACNILHREFDKFSCSDIITVSAENNYNIVSYLDEAQSIRWLVKRLSELYVKTEHNTFSDRQIICNNLLAALIEENQYDNSEKIEELSHTIQIDCDDSYHSFYLHQNRMTLYFLNKNFKKYNEERKLCCVPGLLSSYEEFFKARADFLEVNINKDWDIQQLQVHLTKWGESYPEKKYSLYKRPILFGFIERWFE